MRAAAWLKETRRELIREKRREIKRARKAVAGLFDGSGDFCRAVRAMDDAFDEMDRITKPLA